MSEQTTRLLEQLYPSMSAEERAKVASSSETVYEDLENTPLRLGEKNGLWYILMGNTVLEKQGFTEPAVAKIWITQNTLTLARQIAATVCYDMIKPYIQMQAAKEAGVKMNNPEIISDGKGPIHGSYKLD